MHGGSVRVLICCLFIFAAQAWAKSNSPHVVFINPGFASDNPTGGFWSSVSLISKAAAKDLNIRLTTLYADRDHIYMKSLVKQAIKLNPDYLILVNEKGVGAELLRISSNAHVKVFFLLNDLPPSQLANLSKFDRQRVVGGVQPNNVAAGRLLTERLLNAPNLHGEKVKLLALQGDYVTQASIDRNKGMMKALEETNIQYELLDSIVANWSKQQGFAIVNGFMERGIIIDRVWAANDAIAFGADKAIKAHQQQTLVGGFNWDEPPTNTVLYTSVGGHVTLGALAIVQIHDLAMRKLQAPLHTMVDIFIDDKTESSQAFIKLMQQNNIDKIDFTRFSLSQSSPLAFTIANLVLASK